MQFAVFWGRCPKCNCTVFRPGPWAGLPFKTWNGLKTPPLTLNGLKRLAEGGGIQCESDLLLKAKAVNFTPGGEFVIK